MVNPFIQSFLFYKIHPAFLFLTANLAPCLWIEQGQAPEGVGHPRYAAVFFPAKPCTIPAGGKICT